jgi:hypothetical protein
MIDLLFAATTPPAKAEQSWLQENATLIVGVVGIVMSGFVGPTVTGWLTSRREEAKDKRALVVARRDDLRELVDEAAKVLGGAVARLRPLLAAQIASEDPPQEPADFLGTLFPLGQRLRLRLPEDDDVIKTFETARLALLGASRATGSQPEFDAAVAAFETARGTFLEAARKRLQAKICKNTEI